jgi:peptide/nickel transport system substrate-binding protein
MDTNHPVFGDTLVRQAINWAIDRERFVDIVLQNIVGPTSIPYPEASIAYDAELAERYRKDLDRSAELLAEAGYGDGFEATIMTSSQRNPGMIELAQILQADLETIGVRLDIEDLEPTVYDPRFLDGDFDLAIHTFGRANKDPATLLNAAVVWYTDPDTNPSGFQSDRYAELVDQGSTTIDTEEREGIYREITELILDESWCIPVAEQPRVWGMQSDVQDFEYTADNMPIWHKVWLDR